MGAIERIFDNFEILHDNYVDMSRTREVMKNMYDYFESQGINAMEAEHYITSIISEYEKQGFLYGFRYAVELLLDGNVTV